MTPARLKYLLIVLVLAGAGGALLASTQDWFTLTVDAAAGGSRDLAVGGAVAAPALGALAFAAIALAAALAIAGPVIRIVLGILGIAVGGSIVLASALALADPVAAGAPVVTAATGVSGSDSLHEIVGASTTTAWPVVAIIAGALVVLACLAVVVTARAWPGSSRRYQAVRFAETDAGSARDTTADPQAHAVDDWDELSRGDDPTA